MRILISGDIHIGRGSSKIAADAEILQARAAWNRLVEFAISEAVDLVLLSGDIADQENKFWEAIGPLEQGIDRLGQAGIQTVAVSGNHDYDVLPRLANELDPRYFRLLGKHGCWERFTFQVDGEPKLCIDGWSFPREHVTTSPLESYVCEDAGGLPVIGLVHGDLGQPTSRYAPLDKRALLANPVDAWVLGHIHAKRLEQGDAQPWILYPGSPQALDPGETGEHGAWLLEVTRGRVGIPAFVPLSTVFYGPCSVDVSGAQDPGELQSMVIHAIRAAAFEAGQAMGSPLQFAALRLQVRGATSLAAEVHSQLAACREDLEIRVGDVSVAVDSLDVDVVPPLDLAALAKTSSALGLAAKILRGLSEPEISSELQTLTDAALAAIQQSDGASAFQNIDEERMSRSEVQQLLREQTHRIVSELAAQRAT